MALDLKPLRAFIDRFLSDRTDMAALWRFGTWGVCAAAALIAVAVASQTERGGERLHSAFAAPAPTPVEAVAIAEARQRAAEAQAETERLAAQLRDLTADRDRLAARVAGLEHNFEDITGSIKREVAEVAARVAPPPADLPKIASVAPAQPAAPAAAAPPEEKAKAVSQDGAAQASPPPLAPPHRRCGRAAAAPPAPPAAPVAAAAPPAPAPEVKLAAAPAAEPALPQPGKPAIGIDIGGSSTLALLNARWAAMKAHHGPLLQGLQSAGFARAAPRPPALSAGARTAAGRSRRHAPLRAIRRRPRRLPSGALCRRGARASLTSLGGRHMARHEAVSAQRARGRLSC